jgi:hypothetical protein
MKFRERASIINNSIELNPDLIVIDENNDTLTFAQVTNDGSPKLIVRYSALACGICLEEELKIIQKYIPKINGNNIIILVSGYNMRNLKTLKKSVSSDIKVYQTEKTGIPFEDKNDNLFLFIADKGLIIKNFFIPEKTLPELSKDYYEIMCDKYWNVSDIHRGYRY